MKKVGILNCSNTTQDFNCSASLCLKDVQHNKGKFENYNEDVELAGIISCDGCPTAIGPEKILKKIDALVCAGAEAIHFSSCVDALFPFKKKYEPLTYTRFSRFDIVIHTHFSPIF